MDAMNSSALPEPLVEKIKKRRRWIRYVVFAFFGSAGLLVLRLGLIPATVMPLPDMSLASQDQWFTDWRLAALNYDVDKCRELLRPPGIHASPVKSNVRSNGCGWVNGFRVRRIAGAALKPRSAIMSCTEAAAMALWMNQVVQPAAKRILKSKVVAISHMGTYNCRSVRGRFSKWIKMPSQHSFANAIDISGFRLANGTSIRLIRHWNSGKKGAFLHEVYRGACDYFRVKLGPNSNKAHRDHFHLDRGFVPSWCSD